MGRFYEEEKERRVNCEIRRRAGSSKGTKDSNE
jgi:hypothetical protein